MSVVTRPPKHSPATDDLWDPTDRPNHDCGSRHGYCMVYDAYWCPECDEWTERTCGGGGCELCVSRPERPSGGHLTSDLAAL